MLEVTDLHVNYGPVNAVRGVSFAASQGEVTLVLGPNGAGKTTSLRSTAGFHKPRSGSITVDGKSTFGATAHRMVRAGVTLVPEGRRVFAPLTVEENLRIGAYTAPKSSIEPTLDEVYDKFPVLSDRRNSQAGLLSGGEQQMLAFGRALMSQPRIMLLDEPSMGLAPTMVDTVMASVRSIADSGIAVLMVEQNADVGMAIADNVVVMTRGQTTWSGDAEEARDNTAIVHAMLGEAALGSA